MAAVATILSISAPASEQSSYPYMTNAAAQQTAIPESEASIIKRHDKLIAYVAQRFSRSGVSQQDLLQEGRIALLQAARAWRAEYETQLWTFAHKAVFGAMLRYVDSNRSEELDMSELEPETPPENPETAVATAECLPIASREFFALRPEEQRIVRLHLIDGRSLRDIAREQGDADHTRVRRIYGEAIAKLRERVGAQL